MLLDLFGRYQSRFQWWVQCFGMHGCLSRELWMWRVEGGGRCVGRDRSAGVGEEQAGSLYLMSRSRSGVVLYIWPVVGWCMSANR